MIYTLEVYVFCYTPILSILAAQILFPFLFFFAFTRKMFLTCWLSSHFLLKSVQIFRILKENKTYTQEKFPSSTDLSEVRLNENEE